MKINSVCYIGGDVIGGPLCAVMALKCPEIRFTLLDDVKNIKEWTSNTIPSKEPDLEEIVKKCRNRNLFFRSEYSPVIKEADMIFLSIRDPAESDPGKGMDLKQFEKTAKLIMANSTTDKIIVEKSSFSPNVFNKVIENFSLMQVPGVMIDVLFCPEVLCEGNLVYDLLNPSRIVIGVQNNAKNRASAQHLKEMYENWVPSNHIAIIGVKSMEIGKMVGNIFLALQMSTFSTLAPIVEAHKGDVAEISRIVGKQSKSAKYLRSSVGLDGVNDDILRLINICESEKLIKSASYWQSILDINCHQRKLFLEKINSVFSPLKDKEIGIWGFASSKNTTNTKFSVGREVCHRLLVEGAKLKIYDPKVPKENILKDIQTDITALKLKAEEVNWENLSVCEDAYAACENTEGVIFCTDWDEFQNLHFAKVAQTMKKPLLLEARRILNFTKLGNSGIELYSIGLNKSF